MKEKILQLIELKLELARCEEGLEQAERLVEKDKKWAQYIHAVEEDISNIKNAITNIEF